jgi:aryl-alcohol dehydrogenase-like predicted oxidoreductase
MSRSEKTLTIGGDLTVQRLGFGAMRITGENIWGEPKDRKECEKVLRRLVALGVNFVDTADSYGPDVSERLIAETLYPYPDDFVIATKGGTTRNAPTHWGRDGSPKHLREACEASLKKLRTSRIDLYQLHAPDPAVPFEDSVGALAELKKEGKIRHVGLSNVSVEELARAQKIVPIVSVQNRSSVADRTHEPVLEACEKQGIAFLPYFPLLAGKPNETAAVEKVAKKHGKKPGQIALAWLLHRSKVMLPIPGTSKVAHLEENVEAAKIALDDEDMKTLG